MTQHTRPTRRTEALSAARAAYLNAYRQPPQDPMRDCLAIAATILREEPGPGLPHTIGCRISDLLDGRSPAAVAMSLRNMLVLGLAGGWLAERAGGDHMVDDIISHGTACRMQALAQLAGRADAIARLDARYHAELGRSVYPWSDPWWEAA